MIRHHRVLHQIGSDVYNAPKLALFHTFKRRLGCIQSGFNSTFKLLLHGFPAELMNFWAGLTIKLELNQRIINHGVDMLSKMLKACVKHTCDLCTVCNISLVDKNLFGILLN